MRADEDCNGLVRKLLSEKTGVTTGGHQLVHRIDKKRGVCKAVFCEGDVCSGGLCAW